MGMWHSTYFFYGVHVPGDQYDGHAWTECERLDKVIAGLGAAAGPVGHISAGNGDQDELFLSVVPDGENAEVELGSFEVVHPEYDPEKRAAWNVALHTVALLWLSVNTG